MRNPYFHRVDANGRQLPYIDRFVLAVADGKLIPAKTGAGEADLQARDMHFNNYTFLKQGEKRNNYRTLLWQTARGSHFALFPNLNAQRPGVAGSCCATCASAARCRSRSTARRSTRCCISASAIERQQHGAAAEPALPQEYRETLGASTTGGRPTRCSTRSA